MVADPGSRPEAQEVPGAPGLRTPPITTEAPAVRLRASGARAGEAARGLPRTATAAAARPRTPRVRGQLRSQAVVPEAPAASGRRLTRPAAARAGRCPGLAAAGPGWSPRQGSR